MINDTPQRSIKSRRGSVEIGIGVHLETLVVRRLASHAALRVAGREGGQSLHSLHSQRITISLRASSRVSS